LRTVAVTLTAEMAANGFTVLSTELSVTWCKDSAPG